MKAMGMNGDGKIQYEGGLLYHELTKTICLVEFGHGPRELLTRSRLSNLSKGDRKSTPVTFQQYRSRSQWEIGQG